MSNSQSKVSSGPPIWIWLLLVPLTLAVLGGIILSSVPPDLDKTYAEAIEILYDINRSKEFEGKIANLNKDPAYADHVSMLRGRLALAQSREPMALKYFGDIPEGSPLEAEAARRSGDAYRLGGNFDKAVEAYRLGLEKDTGDGLEARMNLASLYFTAKGIDLALEELNKNIEIEPKHEPSRMLRSQIRIFREKYELAQEDFEAVLDSPGKFSSAAPYFVTEYFKCLVQLNDVEKLTEVTDAHLSVVEDPTVKSSVLCKLGQYRDAMVVLQAMEGPESESGASKRAKLELLLSEGNLKEAKLLATDLVTLVPRDIPTMALAAKTFEACGETRMQKIAEENVRQLTELKGELRAAIDHVSGDITDGPGRAKAARLYREMSDFRQMESWYQVAVMLDQSLAPEFVKARSGEGFPTEPLVSFDEPNEKTKESPSETAEADKPKGTSDAEPKPEKKKAPADAAKVGSDEEESGSQTDKSSAAEKPDPKAASAEKVSREEAAVDKPAAEGKKAEVAKQKEEAEAAKKDD